MTLATRAAKLTRSLTRGSRQRGLVGNVDFNFKPSVPVFDANVALGRRHDRPVRVDTVEGTLDAMGKAGVQRAVVHSPHAANFDGLEGNQILMDAIRGEPGLFPQFVFNPTFDNLDAFSAQILELSVRSVRIYPKLHKYPFRDWIVKPWLDRFAEDGVPVWMPAAYDFQGDNLIIDPTEVHDTLEAHPDLNVTLTQVHYSHRAWALPLLRGLPNLYVELSHYVITDGIAELIDAVGEERVMFGSRFPDSQMGAQLYHLHRMGLSEESLKAICSGNLERLLGLAN